MDAEQFDSPNEQQKSKELKTKEAYFARLSQWAEEAKAAQLMSNYLYLNYNYNYNCNYYYTQAQNRNLVQPMTRRRRRRFDPVRVLDDVHQREVIHHFGGSQMLIAPFWKRALAEFLDALILSVVKVALALGFVRIFSIDLENSLLSKAFKEDNPFMALFDLSMDIISLPYNLLIVILLTKLNVCLYECWWTIFNNGATPGKWLMKIRVVYVEAVVPLQHNAPAHFIFQGQTRPQWAMLYPCETPSFTRSLLRALTKNMVVTFFFPVCIVMILLKNNRTTYDIVTKTVVVESTPNQPHPHHF